MKHFIVVWAAVFSATLAFAGCSAQGQNAGLSPYAVSGWSAAPSTLQKSAKPVWFYIGATQDPGGIFTFAADGSPTSPSPGFSIGFVESIAYDPGNHFLYVVAEDAVRAYDRKGTVQALSFADKGEPEQILYNPKNHLLYVANAKSTMHGVMKVYDEYGVQQVAGKFHDMPRNPQGMTCDPKTGNIYVTGYNSGVVVYTMAGKRVPAAFTGASSPFGIAYDQHDGLIYVVTQSASTPVSAFTTAGVPVSRSGSWSGAPDPFGLAFDSHTNLIYVTNYSTGTVNAYDEQGNKQTLTGFSGIAPSLGIGPIAIVPQ